MTEGEEGGKKERKRERERGRVWEGDRGRESRRKSGRISTMSSTVRRETDRGRSWRNVQIKRG